MGQSTGHAGAIFAADGSGRHRAVRIAVAAGAALLVAWLIALALGVLGGFGSLPGLPSASHSGGSHEASARTHRATTPSVDSQREAPVKTVAPSAVDDNSSPPQSQSSTPKASSVAPVAQPPSTSATNTGTTHGQSSTHTTQTTGKPVGSPGNGAGGSGAPGKLR